MKKIKIESSVVAKIKSDILSNFFSLMKKENVLDVIRDLIRSGVSPVAGVKRRFQRYSESYKQQLKGKLRFFTSKTGQVIAVPGKFPPPFPGKNPTKVNLTQTGEMLDSLYMKKTADKVYIGFKDEKAEFHNDLGAGKSKVVRRLLPTNKDEEFVRNVSVRLKQIGKDALKKSIDKNRKILKFNFVLRKKL